MKDLPNIDDYSEKNRALKDEKNKYCNENDSVRIQS